MKTDVYDISVKGWGKHNQKLKKGHEYFLVSKYFFYHDKIVTTTPLTRLLYLTILALCAIECSTNIRPTHHQLSTMLGQDRYDILTSLKSLQENQLLSFKTESRLINRRDIKGHKETSNSVNGDAQKTFAIDALSKKVQSVKKPPAPDGTNFVIAEYCDKWRILYQQQNSPPIGGRNAKLFKTLVQDFGKDRVLLLIDAYLKMADPWFITKRHDVQTLVTNLNVVSQFAETGKLITKRELNQLDRSVTNGNTLAALRNGEV